MDNTINCFSNHFITYAKKLGYPIDPNYSDETYHIETCILLSKKEQKKIMAEIMDSDDFWLTIPPKKSVNTILEYLLILDYELVIVTIPWKDEERFKQTKKTWLETNFPSIPFTEVIFKKEKWEIPGDIIIDDKPEVLERAPMTRIKFFYPYNAHIETEYSINNWGVVPSILEEINKCS